MNHDLSLDDISAIVRLLGETIDRWDDPRSWRSHLLRGACRLLGGTVGMMLSEYGGEPGRFGRLAITSVVGLDPALQALVGPAVSQLEYRPYEDVSQHVLPGMTTLYNHIVRQGWVTAARRDIIDDAAYRTSPYYTDFRKRVDCDDFVVSVRLVDAPRRAEAIGVDRPHGVPGFSRREVTVLKILHDEVAPLIGIRLATEDYLSRHGLSARLRQTLALLLDGRSEKEAAAALRLSPRTIHEYVTALYEHFEVCSRAELLAYFIHRKPIPRTRH